MTAVDAKRAFREWCKINGYVITLYNKTGKKVKVEVASYVTDLDEYERSSLIEAVIIRLPGMFYIQVEPNVRVRENSDILKFK